MSASDGVPLHLDPKGLAARWLCSVGWLANQRSNGTGLPYRKIGSKILYAVADVEAAEAKATVTALAA